MEITCNTASGILVIQPVLKLIVFFVCTAKPYEQTKLLLINLSVLPLLYKITVSASWSGDEFNYFTNRFGRINEGLFDI